jgi:hypothetical protein
LIIAFNHESKLCKICCTARAQGDDVIRPGHKGCTATIGRAENSGNEKLGGNKVAEILCSGLEPITIGKISTDADGRMAEGIADVFLAYKGTSTESFLDTTHLNRSVAVALSRAKIHTVIVQQQL